MTCPDDTTFLGDACAMVATALAIYEGPLSAAIADPQSSAAALEIIGMARDIALKSLTTLSVRAAHSALTRTLSMV